jgi:hypothetical protein
LAFEWDGHGPIFGAVPRKQKLGIWGVLKRGVSQNRWFTMENPSKMDENG